MNSTAERLEALCRRLGVDIPEPVGELLCGGRYQRLQSLGEGAQGRVDLVVDRHLDREVAAKVVTSDDLDACRQLVDEARLTGALQHPNIVPTYELGIDDHDTLFFTMRRLPGRTLRDVMIEEPLSTTRRLSMFVDICRAMEHAHEQGILHTDLKPENVLVGSRGEVLVGDWGLARRVDEDITDFAGTPLYMSPEQVRCERLGPTTDVWSLGVLLFELLIGEVPFTARSLEGVLESVLSDPLPSLKASASDIPVDVEALLVRSLTRDRAARTQSVTELRVAIEDIIEGRRQRLELERKLDDLLAEVESASNPPQIWKQAFELAPEHPRLIAASVARYWAVFSRGLQDGGLAEIMTLGDLALPDIIRHAPTDDTPQHWLHSVRSFLSEQATGPQLDSLRGLVNRIEGLRGNDFVADLEDHQLLPIAEAATWAEYEPHASLFEAGEPGNTLYCVVEGSIDIEVTGRVVNRLEPGRVLGEVALLSEARRSAAARAGPAGARCLALSATAFREVVLKHGSVAWSVMRLLAQRLEAATAREAES